VPIRMLKAITEVLLFVALAAMAFSIAATSFTLLVGTAVYTLR
jgi:hypothetical protein